ncbi:type III-B CRISPR module-associated protein Cmr5 [Candidatus Bathyarchaeota archaeon]|nr:MAG: type III-B CRISPR module-associated protein Cmr5 [Candidatus Bathyarchaeota archaeon]
MSDRIAEMYEYVWEYIKLLKRLEKTQKKFTGYSERYASLLQKEGVLSTLSFIASKSSRNARKELSRGVEGYSDEELVERLKDVEAEALAHSILYDCYARWLVKRGLINVGERYVNDPLVVIKKIAEGFGDLGLKYRITEELSRLAIAVKYLAIGEFGR